MTRIDIRGVQLAAGEGERVEVGTDHYHLKGGSTDGSFSVIEYTCPAGAAGPPLHLHRSNEEAFYVLEGVVDFTLDGNMSRMSAGSFVLVPRNVPHTFVNAGQGVARWVGIFSPGNYEKLVRELGAVLPAGGPPNPRDVAEVFARWDTEVLS